MKREYSKILKGLLEKWDDPSTLRFVGRRGVLSRNWRMQCLEAGVVDGHKWKQREIAKEYKLTIARVSKILEEVRNRLSDNAEEVCRADSLRGCRRKWHGFLRENPISNATMGAELVDLLKISYREGGRKYLPGNYYFECIVDGKYLCSESCSYFRLSADRKDSRDELLGGSGDKFMVFWMKEDFEGVRNVNLHWDVIRSAKLFFFYDSLFWVIDKVVGKNRAEKLFTVHLKPAEYGSFEVEG